MWKYWNIKTILWAIGASVTVVNCAVAAPTLQDQVNELEQKLDVLQRQMEIKDETSDAKSKDAATVKASYDSKGFVLKTGDGSAEFRANAFMQADSHWYSAPSGVAPTTDINTFVIRRARLQFTGTVGKYYSYMFQPSWDGGTADLQDAWINAGFKPYFNVRVGRFKVPFGLERLQSSTNNSLVETGFTTYLTPNYDVGVQFLGTINAGPSALDYQLAIVNGGAQEGGTATNSAETDTNDGKEWAIRMFGSPFKNSSIDALKGLGVGVAFLNGKSGPANGTANTAIAGGSYTVFQGLPTLANFANASVTPDTNAKRFSPQAYWYYSSFGLLGEYVSSRKTLYRTGQAIATSSQDIKNTAWQVIGSWVITGETPTYNSGITPKKAFLKDGGVGAVELAVRYQVLNLDGKNFVNPQGTTTNAILSRATAVSQAKGIGASINWYLSKNVKFQLDFDKFTYTDGGGGTATAPLDRKDDKTLFTRTQVTF